MAVLAAIADQVGTYGGITSATASSALLDGGFAEQFREDQVTFSDPLYDTYYAEGDIFAATGLMSASGVTALGVRGRSWTDPFSYDWGVRLHRAAVGRTMSTATTIPSTTPGSWSPLRGGALLDSADRFVCEVAVLRLVAAHRRLHGRRRHTLRFAVDTPQSDL